MAASESSNPKKQAPHPHKLRTGLNRLNHAFLYSMKGLVAGWGEKAFRMEACFAIVLLPLAFYVGQSWLEVAMLCAVVVLVLVTELLNSGIESAIDRIGPELHEFSKRAKDMGSAAVFLSLVLCSAVWAAALYQKF